MNSPSQPVLPPPVTAGIPAAPQREMIVDELLLSTPPGDVPMPQPRPHSPLAAKPEEEPIQPRLSWSIGLFLATCVTTFYAGASEWQHQFLGANPAFWKEAWLNEESRTRGLEFMSSVMAILLAHEMGHYVMTRKHRIAATYPIFLPFPLLVTGTLGAVIAMDPYKANRKQVFDVGIAGPLAGLVLIIPILSFGIQNANFRDAQLAIGPSFGEPWLMRILMHWLRPELGPNVDLVVNPWLMAGWVGCLITGLNMLPMSQLDGGHVVYCLFGKGWGRFISQVALFAAMSAIIVSNNYPWTAMLLLVICVLGINHPPTSDDTVKLGPTRTILGVLSLAIPVLCFIPRPFILG